MLERSIHCAACRRRRAASDAIPPASPRHAASRVVQTPPSRAGHAFTPGSAALLARRRRSHAYAFCSWACPTSEERRGQHPPSNRPQENSAPQARTDSPSGKPRRMATSRYGEAEARRRLALQLVMATKSAAGISNVSAFDNMISTSRPVQRMLNRNQSRHRRRCAAISRCRLWWIPKRDERRLQNVMEMKRS